MVGELAAMYALQFVGVKYKWGGENPLEGFDCSGFVQEVLRSVGKDPKGDQTADALHRYCIDNFSICKQFHPTPGSLVFYGTMERVTHVAIAYNHLCVIEAGGGNSRTNSLAVATKQGAFVRMRPYVGRKDVVGIFNIL